MTRVVACYKWVLDEADIMINSDDSLDFSKAKWKISEYDKNAIEAAVRAARVLGGEAVGLTFGGERTKQSLKEVLSRGLDAAYWINSSLAAEADNFVTAEVLAIAVKNITDVSLVVCAEGASDTFARQTAPRLGASLDWPVITSVAELTVRGNKLIAKRRMDDCSETVEVELPAVIGVLPEINDAPLPSLKAVIESTKKPVTEFTAETLGITDVKPKAQVKWQKAYIVKRKNVILTEGDTRSRVRELVANLKKEGVL